MNEYMNKLPDKPSELLRVALADLRKCEEDKNYYIEMSMWHEPTKIELPSGAGATLFCQVCLGGAVMAQTLEFDFSTDGAPSLFDHNTRCKLHALNDFRMENVATGLSTLEIPHNEDLIPARMFVPTYRDDRELFYQNLEVMAKLFEEAGI